MPPAREAFFVVAWCKHPLGASPCLVQASAWCKHPLGASPCLKYKMNPPFCLGNEKYNAGCFSQKGIQ